MLRLALCLATAVSVAVTAYVCAWLSYGDFFQYPSRATRGYLKHLGEDIARYREKTGHLPARLSDVTVMGPPMYPVDAQGRPLDVWGRPFLYQVTGDSYDLFSFGEDGLPGGLGLDADLHAGWTSPLTEYITFWQFAAAEPGGVKFTCVVAGVLAFPLCLFGSKPGPAGRPGLAAVLVKNGVTVVFAVGAALVISILHVSGH
jgi:general secretion pathway protein G